MTSAHFSQRKQLRRERSVTVEQEDHNAFFVSVARYLFFYLSRPEQRDRAGFQTVEVLHHLEKLLNCCQIVFPLKYEYDY